MSPESGRRQLHRRLKDIYTVASRGRRIWLLPRQIAFENDIVVR